MNSRLHIVCVLTLAALLAPWGGAPVPLGQRENAQLHGNASAPAALVIVEDPPGQLPRAESRSSGHVGTALWVVQPTTTKSCAPIQGDYERLPSSRPSPDSAPIGQTRAPPVAHAFVTYG